MYPVVDSATIERLLYSIISYDKTILNVKIL